MAPETEGIALLRMYNDEEEEEEEEEEQRHHHQQHQEDGGRSRIDQETDDAEHDSIPKSLLDSFPSRSPQDLSSPSPEVKTLRSPTPSPWPKSHRSSPLNLAFPSPTLSLPHRPLPQAVDALKARRGALAIVDYAHDEAAMSPEAEEGEIVSSGQVVVAMVIQTFEGNFEERTPPGTVQLLTPSTQPEPPQPSDIPDQSRCETSMPIDSIRTEPEIAQAEVVTVVSEEVQKDDPLKIFLPPPVTARCSEELLEKINKFLAYKKAGKSFNAALRNSKDYRNPDFLQHAVRYQDIDQIGTCFGKDVFDPHGYDKSEYYDEIASGSIASGSTVPSALSALQRPEADMKREMERKELERKKSPNVEFVPGGTKTSTVATALKIGTQITGVSATVTSGSVSTVPDATGDIRQNKKSKWDKIDGDIKNPVPSSGHDNLSAVGVNAAHLSAANAGSGYTAFAPTGGRRRVRIRDHNSQAVWPAEKI